MDEMDRAGLAMARHATNEAGPEAEGEAPRPYRSTTTTTQSADSLTSSSHTRSTAL
jgi:hypothetical protein